MSIINEISDNGFYVLRNVFDVKSISEMRDTVMDNYELMARTRPYSSSLHLAGFHRFPKLESLHQKITNNECINSTLSKIYKTSNYLTIGLSDITVNRSQPWHTDLLRGKYSTFLKPNICWAEDSLPCLKALLYLQDGKSLKVCPGTHKQQRSLSNDCVSIPIDKSRISEVEVRAGDIIIMDIRLVHRGSSNQEMESLTLISPKILISTVFGPRNAPLTLAMQKGNAHRQTDWDHNHL